NDTVEKIQPDLLIREDTSEIVQRQHARPGPRVLGVYLTLRVQCGQQHPVQRESDHGGYQYRRDLRQRPPRPTQPPPAGPSDGRGHIASSLLRWARKYTTVINNSSAVMTTPIAEPSAYLEAAKAS